MHKFFVPKQKIKENIAVIEGEDVKHIYKVLRLSEGEEITINNCDGGEFLGKIKSVDKKEVLVEIINEFEINNESNIEIHLFQGIPKSTKMDLIVQKTTELGITSITPVFTKRVVVNGSRELKIDRWNKIVLEACKQSKRSLIPQVNNECDFNVMIEKLKEMDLVVVPYENKKGYGLKKMFSDIDKQNIRKIGIIIGPEGGFEEEEIKLLESENAQIVTLGPRILRTETAGFTALSVIMYEIGDLGGQI